MNLAPRLDELRLALMLLTRLPVERLLGPMRGRVPLAASGWAWPLVGALVGACQAAVLYLGLRWGLPAAAAALLALAVGMLVTGALHEDGLGDLADGFGGGRDRARTLEIMRDSRLGSYGALALVLAVGLQVALISALPVDAAVAALVGLGAASRGFLPLVQLWLPQARAEGLGASAAAEPAAASAWAAGLIGAALALLLAPGAALVLLIAAQAAVLWLACRQIGGVTGDVLGAAQLLGLVAGLMAV